MSLPSAETPLYSHTLAAIEAWLSQQGCSQSANCPEQWNISRPEWQAQLEMDVDQFIVHYQPRDGREPVTRVFKYALSRSDLEAAIFAGP
jgi:hypothetical protein